MHSIPSIPLGSTSAEETGLLGAPARAESPRGRVQYDIIAYQMILHDVIFTVTLNCVSLYHINQCDLLQYCIITYDMIASYSIVHYIISIHSVYIYIYTHVIIYSIVYVLYHTLYIYMLYSTVYIYIYIYI